MGILTILIGLVQSRLSIFLIAFIVGGILMFAYSKYTHKIKQLELHIKYLEKQHQVDQQYINQLEQALKMKEQEIANYYKTNMVRLYKALQTCNNELTKVLQRQLNSTQ